jgi:DNA polymerase-3 subunit epsilon
MTEDRDLAIWRFENILNKDTLILGLATTGEGKLDEIIEVCLVDLDGNILMDQLIRPTVTVSEQAHKINGISFNDLVDEPSYLSIYTELLELVEGKVVCIYNADIGARIIRQTSQKYNLESPLNYTEDIFCIMENYSEIKDEYDKDWSRKKYKSILEAAREENIEYDSERGTRARVEALIAYQLIQSISYKGQEGIEA